MAGFISRYLVPPIAILAAPVIVQFLVNVSREEGLEGFSPLMLFGDPFAWLLVSIWLVIAASLLMIPFDKYRGHSSPGHVGLAPEYTDNCGGAYMTATGSYLAFHSIWMHQSLFVYNNFPYVMGAMYVFTLTFSTYLWHQAKKTNQKLQSNKDKNVVVSRSAGPALYEICRGVDYHPSLMDYFDIKQWAVVRVGFLSWQSLVIAFFYAGYLLHSFNWGHLVTTLLQSYYIVKGSLRESIYLASLDDYGTRPGFYLLWVTMNLAPVMNTFTTYYFVAHVPSLPFLANLTIFLLGFGCIYVKYSIDGQKDLFKLTNGNCNIWGRKATYVEAASEAKEGKLKPRLLTSGFWGLARHVHYVFEYLSVVCWCLPGIGTGDLWPFLPLIYVIITLVYRMVCDEAKCSAKYGPLWDQYCKTVKYRLIPYIY